MTEKETQNRPLFPNKKRKGITLPFHGSSGNLIFPAGSCADRAADHAADHGAGDAPDMGPDSRSGHSADSAPENAFLPVPAAVDHFHFIQIQFHRIGIHFLNPFFLRFALILSLSRRLHRPCTCIYATAWRGGSEKEKKQESYLAWFDIIVCFLLCVFDYPAEVFRESLDLLFLAVSVQQRQRIAQEVGVEGYKAGLLTREQALEELKSRGEELGGYTKV